MQLKSRENHHIIIIMSIVIMHEIRNWKVYHAWKYTNKMFGIINYETKLMYWQSWHGAYRILLHYYMQDVSEPDKVSN